MQRRPCNGSWRLGQAPEGPWVDYGLTNGLIKNLPRSRRLRTPTNRHLPPRNPPRTPPSQVLTLGDQTVMNRAGQQGDAVPAHLITEVLASHTDPGGAGRSKDIYFQIIPLLSGNGINSRHRSQTSTSVPLATVQEVKANQKAPCRSLPGGLPPAAAQRPHGRPGCHLGDGAVQCSQRLVDAA